MQDYDWSDWTDWQNLGRLDFKQLPIDAGAYVIATGIPINRTIGTDPSGFIDIGQSTQLRQRIRDFKRCANVRHDEGHSAGYIYNLFHFYRHHPYDTLLIRWTSAKDKDVSEEIEATLMHEYIERHAELPPLNSQFNYKLFKKHGWEFLD